MTDKYKHHDRVQIVEGQYKGEIGHITEMLGDNTISIYVPFSGCKRYVLASQVQRC